MTKKLFTLCFVGNTIFSYEALSALYLGSNEPYLTTLSMISVIGMIASAFVIESEIIKETLKRDKTTVQSITNLKHKKISPKKGGLYE